MDVPWPNLAIGTEVTREPKFIQRMLLISGNPFGPSAGGTQRMMRRRRRICEGMGEGNERMGSRGMGWCGLTDEEGEMYCGDQIMGGGWPEKIKNIALTSVMSKRSDDREYFKG